MLNNDFLICYTMGGIYYVTEDNKIVDILHEPKYVQDSNGKCYQHPCNIVDIACFCSRLIILYECNNIYISHDLHMWEFHEILEDIGIASIIKNYCSLTDMTFASFFTKYLYFISINDELIEYEISPKKYSIICSNFSKNYDISNIKSFCNGFLINNFNNKLCKFTAPFSSFSGTYYNAEYKLSGNELYLNNHIFIPQYNYTSQRYENVKLIDPDSNLTNEVIKLHDKIRNSDVELVNGKYMTSNNSFIFESEEHILINTSEFKNMEEKNKISIDLTNDNRLIIFEKPKDMLALCANINYNFGVYFCAFVTPFEIIVIKYFSNLPENNRNISTSFEEWGFPKGYFNAKSQNKKSARNS